MAETTKITTLDNGPFLVNGSVVLTDAEGNQFDLTNKPEAPVALCRCGEAVRSCWFPAKSNC
ncbi:CDGSH iron-sulfur domain-containing protein [Pleurocapsa sp. FMAR1]|uniref:CDGSH iron-sulfur domain-containing protein n=1 Tax=Pleurocapsa sp. FMAR1 TaxID=3040204 RepID=UPI0029C863A7|nr:CDGSH iron-sulfur domain-containing protein [Pleurocapsa sp. FMAR1]